MNSKKILRSVAAFFSLRLILFLVLIVASLAVYIYASSYFEEKKERKAQEQAQSIHRTNLINAAKAKNWDSIYIPQKKIKLARLKTKYYNGEIQYILKIRLDEGFNFTELDSKKEPFIITFIGSDDFNLFSIDVNKDEMTQIVDNSEKRIGLEFNGQQMCELNVYLAINKWELSWRF